MSRRFTREEFYELVWSKPMTHLAKDFRLSDVALHKICRKHDIPNPPLGWWAKHAAGHKVKRIPLPKAKAGIALTVVIASVRHEAAARNLIPRFPTPATGHNWADYRPKSVRWNRQGILKVGT